MNFVQDLMRSASGDDLVYDSGIVSRNKLTLEEANDLPSDCGTLGVSLSEPDANAICDIFRGD